MTTVHVVEMSVTVNNSHIQDCGQPRLFTVVYFSVRSSRSRALRYGLSILHECQNYLGDGGGGGGGGEKIEKP